MDFRISAYSAIIYAVWNALITTLDLFNYSKNNILIIIATAIAILAVLTMFLGYISLAKINENRFLKIMSYLQMIFITISILAIASISLGKSPDKGFLILIVAAPIIIIDSVINIIFGISLFKLKSVFGRIILIIGIFYILAPLLSLSNKIIPFIIVVPNLFEAILFFRAAKIYYNKKPVATATETSPKN